MLVKEETIERLARIPNLSISQGTLLSRCTRFGIGGPAEIYAQTPDPQAFIAALDVVRDSGMDHEVIGGGTNLIVSDSGFRGIVLRFTADAIEYDGTRVRVAAGAVLQALVDGSIVHSLKGLETMTGIPGSVGAAIYGNAGAYGHSISELISSVRFYDGSETRTCDNRQCEFEYRESVFKRRKDWIIFSADLEMHAAQAVELRRTADDILTVRTQKYPPTMKCAGSIFKNLILKQLPDSVRQVVPEKVIREGKVPSAWFLEEVGAKGIRNGDIHVADYHANLIYNAGRGTARELCEIIDDLKARVHHRFGFDLEEEVQYVGFRRNGSQRSGVR
jgi:UDP-N-acetylmuramate dehydrogenase